MSKGQRPTIPDTSLGTSDSSLAENLSGIKSQGSERHPLNIFQDDIARALVEGPQGDDAMPIVETTREVIHYYNRDMSGFDAAGFFIFRDCMVCEKGKADEVRANLGRSTDDILHPKSVVMP